MIEKYFWRIIVEEDGREIGSGQGYGDTAKAAAKILALWLHEFVVYKFPQENGHTITIKTIFEEVATVERNSQSQADGS